jgi:hypothetical protein
MSSIFAVQFRRKVSGLFGGAKTSVAILMARDGLEARHVVEGLNLGATDIKATELRNAVVLVEDGRVLDRSGQIAEPALEKSTENLGQAE